MSTSKSDAPYHHGDLRRALVAAALQLIEKQEFSTIGLREVARAAQVSPGAPYRHFRNREALLAAVAAEGFEMLAQAFQTAADASGGEAKAMGLAYLDFALANRNLFRLMFNGEIRKDDHPDLRAAADRAIGPLRGAMGGDATNAREAAVGAWALVHGLASLLVDDQLSDDLTAPQARQRLAGIILDIFGRGLRTAPSP